MAKGISAQALGQMIGKIATKTTPASVIAQTGLGTARQISVSTFQYDFVGLVTKLLVFLTLTFLFAKFMEATIYLRGGFVVFAKLFGINIPSSDQIPEPLKRLFGEGYQGFKYWDIVKVATILLIIAEYFQYKKTTKEVPIMTSAIFISLVVIMGVVTIPELYQRIKQTDFKLDSMR